MTAVRTDIKFTNSSITTFRTWGKAISDSLQAIGLTLTTDTGQVNWTTYNTGNPAVATNQFTAYEIYRFSDTLQSTKPIFIKIMYGWTNMMTPSTVRIGVSVGTGTDGAGNLTGLVSTIRGDTGNAPTTFSYPNNSNNPQPCYFFSDGSSFAMALNPTSTGNTGQSVFFWFVERTRNSDNSPNGDGFVYGCHLAQREQGLYYTQFNYLSWVTSTVVGTNFYWPIPYSSNSYGSGIDGAATNFYPFLVGMPKPEAQACTVLGMHAGDVNYYQTVQVIVNGGLHTYLALPGVVGTMPGNSVENNGGAQNWAALLMRYE